MRDPQPGVISVICIADTSEIGQPGDSKHKRRRRQQTAANMRTRIDEQLSKRILGSTVRPSFPTIMFFFHHSMLFDQR
jgi:hypothetical protein